MPATQHSLTYMHRAAEREKERVEVEKKRSLRPKRKSSVVVRRITQVKAVQIHVVCGYFCVRACVPVQLA